MTTDTTLAGRPAGPRAPLLTREFGLLLVSAAIFGLSFSAYFLLPKFLAVQLAADASTIGSVSAISWLASVISVPLVGGLIDRHGRKRFASLGAVLFAVACAGFLIVDSVGPLLWILRILQGFAFTFFYVSLSTLATDIAPPARLGQAIGLFGAVMISTNAIGPALAEWIAQQFGWALVFGMTVIAAGSGALLVLLIPEPRKIRARDNPTSMLQVIRRPGLQRVLIVLVMVGVTFGGVFTFYQPWALTLGFTQVSTFLMAYALAAMSVRVGLGGLADRLGRLRVAKAALLLYVCAPFALIWLDALGLFLTGALLGLAHGMFYPALNAVAVDYAPESQLGKAMGAVHGAFNIGFAAGSYFLGMLAIATGYPTIFCVAGATCFTAFILLLGAPKLTPQESH
jgi:MFS family permease